MDNPPSSSLDWARYAVEAGGIILAGAASSFFTWLVLRRKVPSEIEVTDAKAEKTRAEARKLDGETIAQAYVRIDEQWEVIEDQREQIRKLGLACMREEFLEEEVKWVKAVLDAAGVELAAYDHLPEEATKDWGLKVSLS